MDKYYTLLPISKFNQIENYFIAFSKATERKVNKKLSHGHLLKRPRINRKFQVNMTNLEICSSLDQIGNDDLIFSDDKLITNLKIEPIDFGNENRLNFENETKNISSIDLPNAQKNYPPTPITQKENKRTRTKTPINKRRIKKQSSKNIFSKNCLDLNCNKKSFVSEDNRSMKSTDRKNLKSSDKTYRTKYKRVNNKKNVSQFINKPENNNNLSSLIMSPISSRKIKKYLSNSTCAKLNSSISQLNDSMTTTSKMELKSMGRFASMPNMKKNLHFPNKSVIKNQDKLYNEMQKLFGEKIQLTEDLYQFMTELDKKNCINFLLEVCKELFNENNKNKTKSENYKEVSVGKDKQIKETKNEIKDLKKEILKLNKVIRTNIQINQKLNGTVDKLKLQLEKEKEKNNNLNNNAKKNNIRKKHSSTDRKYLNNLQNTKNRKYLNLISERKNSLPNNHENHEVQEENVNNDKKEEVRQEKEILNDEKNI